MKILSEGLGDGNDSPCVLKALGGLLDLIDGALFPPVKKGGMYHP